MLQSGSARVIARRWCSTERTLSEALSRVAAAVKEADPGATVAPAGASGSLPAGVRSPGAKMVLRFECTHTPCDSDDDARVTTKVISKRSYEQGARLARRGARAAHAHALRPVRRNRPRAVQLRALAPHCRQSRLVRGPWGHYRAHPREKGRGGEAAGCDRPRGSRAGVHAKTKVTRSKPSEPGYRGRSL